MPKSKRMAHISEGSDSSNTIEPVSETQVEKVKICILNSPIYSNNEIIFLDNLLRILEPIANNILVIVGNFPKRYGNNVHIIEIESGKKDKKRGAITRIMDFLTIQFKLSLSLLRYSRAYPIVFFYVGEYRNILPLIFAKILGKKVIIQHQGGNKFLEAKLDAVSSWERTILPLMPRLLIPIAYTLADVIICLSSRIISFGKLERYRHKIMVLPARYVDFERFKMKKPPSERKNMVGYIGRLVPKKGVEIFVKSIPLITEKYGDVEFLIVGRGVLEEKIKGEIKRNSIRDKVKFTDWVSDEELPEYLNQLKLFVLPSSEEGVPFIVQEAMACGAIVVATPVGGIPDLIKDGETGFIINENIPEEITKIVIKALNSPNLNYISEKARTLIEEEYNYNAVLKKYKTFLHELLNVKIHLRDIEC